MGIMRGNFIMRRTLGVLGAVGLALSFGLAANSARATDISFYYPVAVGGPITKIIDGMVEGF
jgi:sn-glycerol 3-phosphate transport system substrate-binding protein